MNKVFLTGIISKKEFKTIKSKDGNTYDLLSFIMEVSITKNKTSSIIIEAWGELAEYINENYHNEEIEIEGRLRHRVFYEYGFKVNKTVVVVTTAKGFEVYLEESKEMSTDPWDYYYS